MKLPAELWPEISELLDEALALDPGERPAWLDALAQRRPECAPHLRGLVGALASDHRGLLEGAPGALLSGALTDRVTTLRPGLRIGDYELLRRIGQGGMASVWLAQQHASVLRTVALKIPHRGLDTSISAVERFTQERDLLATLEHPHIARLYDAGVGADGTPYLAMEWIDGVLLTRWCDERRLTVRARLATFLQVLRAVQYAHGKLVIHRDLKPSNILVTADGQVKLLDFGIAQMLHETGGEAGAEADTWTFTPDSASPEQLAGRPLDTACDVYALGVLLYELLTGARPYRLSGAMPQLAAELAGLTVAAPSALALAPALTHAAADARSARPRALRNALAGDVDAIVQRAMQRRPEDRYAGAAELAADVLRHLEHRPVAAAPAAVGYRLRCFLRRNRGGVVAASLVAMALFAGTGLAWWQAQRASAEARRASAQARRAQAVQSFLVRLFAANEPERAQGRQQTARELLDRGAGDLATQFAAEPRVRAALHRQVGAIYVSLGDNVAARPHIEAALGLHEGLRENDSTEAIEARFLLAELLEEEGLYEEAHATGDQVLALGRQHSGEDHRWALPTRRLQAWGLMERGQAQDSLNLLQKALADSARHGRDAPDEVLRARSGLGNVQVALGQSARGRDTFAAIVAEAPTVPRYEKTDVLAVRYNLARARYNLGEWATCVAELGELVPAMDLHLGARHDRTIKARSLWAQALAELGRIDEGIGQQRDNLGHARARGRLGEDLVILQTLALAKLYRSGGRFVEGVALAEPGMAQADRHFKKPTWITERGRWIQGDLLAGADRLQAGLQALRQAVERARTLPDHATHPMWADILQSLALTEHRAGNRAAALESMERAARIYVERLGAENAATLRCSVHLAWLRAHAKGPLARRAFVGAGAAYSRATGDKAVVRAELAWMDAALTARAGDSAAAAAKSAAEAAIRAALGAGASARFIGLH